MMINDEFPKNISANVCLKLLREKLQKLKIGKFDNISSNLHLFLISTKKTIFGKGFIIHLRPILLI